MLKVYSEMEIIAWFAVLSLVKNQGTKSSGIVEGEAKLEPCSGFYVCLGFFLSFYITWMIFSSFISE